MLFKNFTIMLTLLISCLYSLSSVAQEEVVESPWKQWVLDRHPDLNCPWLIASNNKKECNWPGEFVGQIVADGMKFEMTVQLFGNDALINLPGNKKNWPTDLTVNQQVAAVIDNNGSPKVHLTKGANIIRGKFLWLDIPAAIALPDSIALVKILREGEVLPTSIKNNQLFLSQDKKSIRADVKNSLKIQVFHALQDDVPLRLTTNIKLFVSGKSREVTIGQASIAGSKTVYLQSVLPARLEEDGMLRVQVKPGVYQITLGSRFSENITTISTNKVSQEWPQDEYLSFIANPQIREVKINAVKSIDTSLFDVPARWKSYPTYRLGKDDQLQLQTLSRGDNAEHQNRININREIWLSFNGKDAISKDIISGEMHQGWRLNAAKSVQLGRASVNSIPVLITDYQGNEGVEIRSPQINLQAVSSIPIVDNINALGWQTDTATLRARIHLPPGWRAVYASGVDGISGTWVQKWNLWDIFWVMILIAMTHKLIGLKGALLMALTLLFTFHEKQAANMLWGVLLAFIAIIGLPIGKYKILLSRLAVLPSALLIIIFIGFSIHSLRLAIYPALEKPGISSYQLAGNHLPEVAQESLLMRTMDTKIAVRSSKESTSNAYDMEDESQDKQALYQVDENDRVQTGPGVPSWSWNALTINSTGAVTADQQINLLLSSPLLTAIWRIINVLLIGLMVTVMLRALYNVSKLKGTKEADNSGLGGDLGSKTSANKGEGINVSMMLVVATLMPLLLLSAPRAQAVALPDKEGYPPEYLLKEYETKLLQAPSCLSSCVSLNNGLLVVKDNQLTLKFEAFSDADIAMPLPYAGDAWQAESIHVDNQQAILRTTKGGLTVYLPKGAHTVTMQGRINNAEIAINLPVNIHNFKVDAPSWLIDGVSKGVVVNNNIGLTSKEVLAQQDTSTLLPLPVKSYAIVQRSIILGKQWQVLTRVEKLAPIVDGGSFNITLLKGEQILSAYPVNENGSVNVQIPKNKKVISWQSSLPQTEIINLKAANNPSYSETWTVIPSSIWNVTFDGIKAIKSDLNSGQYQPTWKPWAGELLAINVSRPAGIAGDIFTTEMAKLIQQSGNNVQKSNLQLKVRASQGTAYEITLPQGVKVNSLIHDGNKMSLNNGNQVVVQLHPGEQSIELDFEVRDELTWRNSSAEIKLPGKTVNIDIEYQLLQDRWLVYLNGPSLGAAMLYWGVLFVILIAAIVLPIIARKLHLNMPINTLGWILLGVGFSTVNSFGIILIALFFFMMAMRSQYIQPQAMGRWKFNALQLTLLALTFFSVLSLLLSIPLGLLSSPEMQVVGNGSYGHLFKFFQDKVSNGALPTVTVYSLPIWFYRVVMLTWSLWVASRIIGWGKWWFTAYSRNGSWIAKPVKIDKKGKDNAGL